MSGLRACFTGYYGMRNFGDDLFGLVCAAASRRYWAAEPRLVGPAIPGVAARYTMPPWYPVQWYGASGAIGKASRLYSFAHALRSADVLVMGGGSVINGRASFRGPMMQSARRAGRLRLAAVGVSIGPFESSAAERKAADFVSTFDYVAVRDRPSHEIGVRMGLGDRLHAGRDLAGLLPLLFPVQARPPQPAGAALRIGVAPCNYRVGAAYPAPDPEATARALVAALAGVAASRRLQVDVFSLNEHPLHGDGAIADALAQALGAAGVDASRVTYGDRDPLAVAAAIARCDGFDSARLHGAIVAYMQGVPFAIVDYHRKCRDFADDIGLPAAQRIVPERQDEAAVSAAIAAMLEGPGPALASSLYARQAQDIFLCAPWARIEESHAA
jgi:polysaccharide pyruvyl transferase WcaK-like protein